MTDKTIPVRVPILDAEPWLAHRPAECVNAFCKPKRWCIGCDPEGVEDCTENPWPCAVVIENDPAHAAGVAAGRAQAAADLRDIGRRFEAEAGQHLADGDRAGADATKQTAMGYWWAANAIVPPHEVARLNTEARITEESS